jgi:hypothetical protein
MCVTSIDGENYVKTRRPEDRTRAFDVTKITKIIVGGETYNIR